MYAIEWMDTHWLPASLRHTLTDVLGLTHSYFRRYDRWVADYVAKRALQLGSRRVVELGAGSAPLTRSLSARSDLAGIDLVPCDLHPNAAAFSELARRWPDRVKPVFEPIDYALPRQWGGNSLLVLSATFHHVPPQHRRQVLESLRRSGEAVLIFEPLKREVASLVLCLLGWVPAWLSPLAIHRKGVIRRIFWCWVFPLAPILFVFDGVVSCLRMWNGQEWETYLRNPTDRTGNYYETLFCQRVEM